MNFSQISGQDPITFLRISASCAVVLRITQNYADTKLRIMVTAIGGSGSAAQIVACPFFDSPASSKGGAADRSEKRQRRRRSSAGRLRREKSGEGAEATSVSYMACGSDHPSYSRSASSAPHLPAAPAPPTVNIPSWARLRAVQYSGREALRRGHVTTHADVRAAAVRAGAAWTSEPSRHESFKLSGLNLSDRTGR